LVTVVSTTACSAQAQPTELTVFGASSLTAALEQITAQYQASHPGTRIASSTGGSSMLRMQIEQGAPADLFLSADVPNPQALADAGRTDGVLEPFATNSLTIVVPEGNPANIQSAADLARPGVRVVAAADEVPIAKYANQAVDKLAALPGYPSSFGDAYHANVVSKEDNVGAVTSKIQVGEGDAAIVYITDAEAADLPTVDIPGEANVVATYAGVVLPSQSNTPSAHALLSWIVGPDGQKILGELGFKPPQ
jgi:molybdate transport system substrate-binding protein